MAVMRAAILAVLLATALLISGDAFVFATCTTDAECESIAASVSFTSVSFTLED